MADGTVDNLNIQVAADANKAVRALNNLASSLRNINSAFSKDISGMRKFSKEVGTMAASINSLGKMKFSSPDVSGLTKVLKTINDVDADNASKTASEISKVVSSFNKLSGTNFNESGINKTINALNRLFKLDISTFNPSGFQQIADSISTIGNMPDVSNSVNRFVSSISRLANAGEKTGQSANNILRLGEETRAAAQRLQSVGNISDDTNLFVQSIGRLASAGNRTGQTASGLSNLAEETLSFFNAMQNAPRVSENTIRMTQALAQLASAGGRVGTATNTISTSFNKLSSIGKKTLSAMKKIASGIVSAFKQIGNSSNHLSKAQFSLGNLLKTVIGFRLGYGLLNFGKQAFELGSDITEVENVVGVAFGNMADKAYEFASTAKEQFGLSELAAKQYSGTMMAMLNSSGVAQDAAAEMSVTLAGLAGDLASFYNIKTDEAFYKLRAAMAGEIEPLRQLGINMTVANLESYALANGITKSYQAMSQAEQQMLRYNYIMSVTVAQQGDFARTSGTWANQVRLLTLNIQSLAATIGQGLIAAVLPALQALNALFAVLQRSAEAFRNFMYVLTGYKPQGSGGFVDELSGIGDVSLGLEDMGAAGGDAASGMDDAADSAKDLDKALSVLSFDQLNQLSDTAKDVSDSLGDASGGGLDDINVPGSGIGGFQDISDYLGGNELPEAISEWAERIRKAFLSHNWDKLGYEIAWGINQGMQYIYDAIKWENIEPKVTPFIDGFTETFNSLVDHIDWDLMGRTLGAGVNTAVNIFTGFIEGIDWENIGTKISVGLRGAISEIDWTNLGNLIGDYFMISWNMISGFVEDMSRKSGAGITGWGELGIAVGNALNGVFEKIDFGKIGTTLANGIDGAFDFLRNFTNTVKWDDLAKNIYTGINNMIRGIDWESAGKSLSLFVTDLLGTFKTVAEETDWEGLGKGIGDFLSSIDWWGILTSVVDIIKETIGGIFDGLESSGTAGKVAAFLGKVFLAVKIADITGISTLVGKIISLIVSNIIESHNISKVKEAFGNLMNDGTKGISGTLTSLGEAASGASTGFGALATSIAPLVGTAGLIVGLGAAFTEAAKGLQNWVEAMQGGNGITTTTGASIKAFIQELASSGAITQSEAQNLFLLSEQLESAGTSADESYTQIASALEDYGVSAGTAEQALNYLNQSQTTTKESMDGLTTAMSGLSEETSNMASQIDLSALDSEKAFLGLEEAVKAMNTQLSLSPSQFTALDTVLMKHEGTGDAQKAYEDLILTLKDMGVNTDTAAKIIAEKIPGAVQKVKDSADTNMKSAKDSVSSATKSMADSTKTNTEEMKNQAEKNLSSVKSTTEETFGSVDATTLEKWGSSTDEVSKNLDLMKQAASMKLSEMHKTVDSYMTSNYNTITDKFTWASEMVGKILDGLSTDVGNKMDTVAGKFSGLDTKIKNNIGDLYSVGQSIMQSLVNGMKSIYIPTPHMYISSWNTHDLGNGGSMSTPNFSVNWYAKGGLFTGMTIAGLGEAGKEAVLPLENHRTMRMISESILSNAPDGIGMSKEELRQMVAEGVSMALMNNSGNQQPINLYATLYTEDNETLARAVAKGQQSIDYRQNPTIQIG